MNRKRRTTAALSLSLAMLVATVPAQAQDPADDWDFGADPSRDLALAAVTFDNFGVAVRCVDDSFSVVLTGLPSGSGRRTLGWRVGEDADQQTAWVSGRDSTTAFSIWPRSVATRLARGGRLEIAARDGETTRRYVVEVPASAQSVSRVFEACGLRLAAPETEAPTGESFAGLRWTRTPTPSFPQRTASIQSGMAALNCTAQSDGSLRQCRIESEFPDGAGFGRAAVLGAHRTGRVAAIEPGQDIGGRIIVFLTRYGQIEGGWMEPPPSRLPGRDEVYNPVRPQDLP